MKVRLPKEMQGGPANMQGMMRQAQKMQEQMEAKNAELDALEYTITAGGGVVTVVIAGTKEIKSITIAPELIDPDDAETLQDILVAAVNEAIKKVETIRESEMSKITGSLSGMPGLM